MIVIIIKSSIILSEVKRGVWNISLSEGENDKETRHATCNILLDDGFCNTCVQM